MKFTTSKMMTMRIKNTSPTLYGHDMNLESTLKQSNSSKGNRNINGIPSHKRGGIASKRIINFDEASIGDSSDNINLNNASGHQGQHKDVQVSQQQSSGSDPKKIPVNFSQDTYSNYHKDNEELLSKKFAMMVPSVSKNPNNIVGGQARPHRSNENPPTLQKFYSCDGNY